MNFLKTPCTHSTVYTWYSSKIHREFMTHGGLAGSIYRHGRSPRVCADDLNALSQYQTIFARTVSTWPYYNLKISPSLARTISMCPTYTQSHVYARAQYYFNIGDDDASQSINMNIIHNHLNYHNSTGEINKTQSHKEFKSIIHQLIPICFGILKL